MRLSGSAKLLLIAGILLFVGLILNTLNNSRIDQSIITPTPIIISPNNMMFSTNGTVVCLPHKDTSGGVTLECAFGLKSEDGNYYSLQNLPQEQIMNGEITIDKKIYVSGVLNPDPSSQYDVAGIITVKDWNLLGNTAE